jgi:hypothetical protein
MQVLADPPDVAGYCLSGKTYTITAAENARLCATIGVAPASDGTAHPIYFYIATQVGMGETVAGLCAVCNFDVHDGPLLGGCSVEFDEPLLVDTQYVVTGEIVSLQRKASRKLGIIDLLEFRLELSRDGRRVLAATNQWILPRGAAR